MRISRTVLALAACSAVAAFYQAFSNEVSLRERGAYREIVSNGIPDHETGAFPNANNPNRIAPQQHQYRVRLQPEAAANATPLGMSPFGVALNGVPFDPGTAEFWQRPDSGWRYEALGGRIDLGLDRNMAHVQPTGAYHYHGMPYGLIAKLRKRDRMVMVGYAADGFPIYALFGHGDAREATSPLKPMNSSYRLRQGVRPVSPGPGGVYDGTFTADYEYVAGSGDLDECNGRFGVTPEYPKGIYHYFITDRFPFIPRLWRGTPDESFLRRGPGPGGPGGPGLQRPGGRGGAPPGAPGHRPPPPPGAPGHRPPPRGA